MLLRVVLELKGGDAGRLSPGVEKASGGLMPQQGGLTDLKPSTKYCDGGMLPEYYSTGTVFAIPQCVVNSMSFNADRSYTSAGRRKQEPVRSNATTTGV